MVLTVLHGVLGLAAFCTLTWLISEDRSGFCWKRIAKGISAQFVIALCLFYIPFFHYCFLAVNSVILALKDSVIAGTSFVFGYVGGGDVPFVVKPGGMTFILGLQALPMVIVIGALGGVLSYWGVIPFLIRLASKILERAAGIGGALGIVISANIFLGVPESLLAIRPYLKQLTLSEVFTMMTMGLAGVAGTVMGLYVIFLKPLFPVDPMGYIISSVVISVPAILMVSRMILPEKEVITTATFDYGDYKPTSSMDALARGFFDGGKTLLAIIVSMIAVLSIVAFVNKGLALIHLDFLGHQTLTIEYLLGFLMTPFMWLTGIPWAEAHAAGTLMATKIVTNELVAYSDLVSPYYRHALSLRSQLIMVYALCGFANLASVGMMIGSFTTLMPHRSHDIARLGMKAMCAGTVCTCMTGTIVGILYSLGVPVATF